MYKQINILWHRKKQIPIFYRRICFWYLFAIWFNKRNVPLLLPYLLTQLCNYLIDDLAVCFALELCHDALHDLALVFGG